MAEGAEHGGAGRGRVGVVAVVVDERAHFGVRRRPAAALHHRRRNATIRRR